MKKYLTTICFSGFYNTLHDSELDTTLEQMFSDRDTGCTINYDLYNRALDKMNWRAVHTAYAKEYMDDFMRWLDLELEFVELNSPRFYNYETDRIFVFITEASLKRAYDRVDTPALRQLVRERFTSRDGFISFYDANLDDWPSNVFEWDANQIGTLLIALANQECSNTDGFSQWDEYELMEQTRGNGLIDDILYCSCPEMERLLKVHDYLQSREARREFA